MRGMNARAMGASALLAAVVALSGDFSVTAADKPKYVPDRTKNPPVAGFLPTDAKLDARALARHIDAALGKRLVAEKAEPSPRCDDAEFLRRVYLDLVGKIPTAEQAVAFLDSKEPEKRAKLIDELLANKDYGRHMADVWQSLLLPRTSDNRRLLQYTPHIVKWLEEEFNAGTGWDKMASDLLTAKGEVSKTGPVVYWLVNATADKVTDNVTRMLMGVQLQCAQCHNHPFTDYKQDEYWGMAAFFLHVRPDGNPRAAAKKGGAIKIVERVTQGGRRKGALPESAKILPPKFLSGSKADVKSGEPVRPALAKWLTTRDNPFFAKAMANRVWSQLMGRGIVNPVDDMHDANPSSHPELLQDLARQFANADFDVKYLFRAICNSEAYQRSARATDGNRDVGPEVYARQQIRPLTPEQLHDSLAQVVGNAESRGRGRGKANPARRQGSPRDAFVAFFGIEDGADPTEYQTGIPQVLQLMNSPRFNNSSSLGKIVNSSKGREEIIESLYLTVLSRRPAKAEQDRVAAYLAKSKDNRREALAGVLWALLNSSEFALNR